MLPGVCYKSSVSPRVGGWGECSAVSMLLTHAQALHTLSLGNRATGVSLPPDGKGAGEGGLRNRARAGCLACPSTLHSLMARAACTFHSLMVQAACSLTCVLMTSLHHRRIGGQQLQQAHSLEVRAPCDHCCALPQCKRSGNKLCRSTASKRTSIPTVGGQMA